MKKIALFLTALGLTAGSVFAQNTLPHADISVQIINPTHDTVVAHNDSVSIGISYTNNGPDTIKAGDTVFFAMSGGEVFYSKILQDFTPGATFVYQEFALVYNPTPDSLTANVCVAEIPQAAVIYQNSTHPNTTYVDTDTVNNISCVKIHWQSPTTGIANHKDAESHNLSVFPNPVNDNLHFNFQAESGEKRFNLTVTNATGQTLIRKAFAAHQFTNNYSVDVSKLTPGVYFLQLQTDSRNLQNKFVIQR